MFACVVCMAQKTVSVLCARSWDSFVSVSATGCIIVSHACECEAHRKTTRSSSRPAMYEGITLTTAAPERSFLLLYFYVLFTFRTLRTHWSYGRIAVSQVKSSKPVVTQQDHRQRLQIPRKLSLAYFHLLVTNVLMWCSTIWRHNHLN